MRNNFPKYLKKIIGLIEVLIGFTAFAGCSIVQIHGMIYGVMGKSADVYIFVIVTAIISFVLGIGMLADREWARKLLIFFSGYIIIIKILIYSGLMVFNGEIITYIPVWSKDLISFFYHSAILILLPRIKCHEGKI